MLPFAVQFKSGQPVYEQVIYAVHKALVRGQLQDGDQFPSVRSLSKELKINPNTAHKIVAALKNDGLLVVEPGRGTFISSNRLPSAEDRRELLDDSVEQLVVQARKLELPLDDVVDSIREKWEKF